MYSPCMNRVRLPEQPYDGYIFDLDGTLVDSMPIHYRAWRQALEEAGAPREAFLPDEFYSCGGKSASDVVDYLNAAYGLAMDRKLVAERKRVIYLDIMARDGAGPIAEVADFARALEGNSPMAIATGSALPGAMATLEAAGLTGLFDIIVTPEDVEHGKPAPDMFLLAARRMAVEPGRCIVFEDAAPGIEAARAAGMDVAIVSTPAEYLE